MRLGPHCSSGGLLIGAIVVACGGRSSPPPQPMVAPSSSGAASAAASAGAATPSVRTGYTCPAAPNTAFTVVPQGGVFGLSEVQVSRDSRIAIARPTATELQIWNLQAGTKVGIVTAPGPISRFALRPDGKALVLVSEGRVFLKDLEKGTFGAMTLPSSGDVDAVLFTSDSAKLFAVHTAQTDVIDVSGSTSTLAVAPIINAISPDGRFLVARDGAVWDVRANRQIWKLPASPMTLAFSEDGSTLAHGLTDRVTVVDSTTGARKWEAVLTGTRQSEVAISPDGQSIAVYDNGLRKDPRKDPVDRGMNLWTRGKKVRLWQARDARPVRATFSPDSTKLAFLGAHISEARNYDHEIKIAEVATGALVMAPFSKSNSLLLTGDLRMESPRWSGDGRSLIHTGNTGLYTFDATKGDRKVIGKASAETAVSAQRDAIWSPDDSSLLLIGERSDRQTFRSAASVMDLKTATLRESLDARTNGRTDYAQRFRAGDWSAAGVAAFIRGDGIVLWDARAAEQTRIIDNDTSQTEDRILAVSPQGTLLLTLVASNKEARVYDARSATKKGVLAVENGTIEAAAFSADGSRIALAADVTSGNERNAQIVIYDTGNGQVVRTLHAPIRRSQFGRGASIHWTPQGRAIVGVDSAGRVDLWNTGTDDPPLNLIDKASGGPSTLAESGNLLLMGRTTIDVWDLRTRTRAKELPGDGSVVEHIRLNHAGTIAAIARGDHVDLFRLADGARLTIRSTHPFKPNDGILVHAENGAFAGAKEAFGQLRVRDGANQLEVRALRPEEATSLYRPTLALDFVAGCPMK